MPFNVAGGINAALGYEQGREHAQDREQLQKDRAFQEEARNQQRQSWSRADQLRADIAAIPQTETVDLRNTSAPQVDDDGNPSAAALPAVVTKDVPMDVQLRQAAAAKRRAGDMEGWLKDHQEADKLMYDRSAKQFQGLIAAAPSMTGGELASQAAQLWNSSNMPFKVGNVRYDENSGQIQVDVDQNGQKGTRTYKNKDEFVSGLQAMADPATFAKLAEKRAEIAGKVAEQAADPSKRYLKVGNSVYDTQTKTFTQGPVPAGFAYIGDDVNGNPQYARTSMGAGGGTGAGAGGKVGRGTGDATVDAARASLETALKDVEDKLTIDQKSVAAENVDRLATQNPKLPPAMAARLAIEVARDPSKLKPAIDPATGMVDVVVNAGPNNGRVVYQRGVASAVKLDNLPLEYLGIPKDKIANMTPQEQLAARKTALTNMTSTMLQQLPPAEAAALRAASVSPEKRRDLEQSLRDQAQQVIAQQTAGKSPEQAAAAEQAVTKALNQRLQGLSNNLDLVYNYARPQEPQKPAAKPGFGRVGGLGAAAGYTPPEGSPAAKAAAARDRAAADQAAKDAAKKADQDRFSAQFLQDSQNMKPLDLVRKYDALRGKLSTADAAKLQALEKTL